MLNKKLMILTIILTCLLAVSAVSAADNVTSEVVSVEEATDEVVSMSYNTTEDVGSEVDTNDNDKLNNFDEDIISYESNNNSLKVIEFDNISPDSNNNLICADNNGIYIKVPSQVYYGDWDKEIDFDWNEGFNGYFEIYNSGVLVVSKKIPCNNWYGTGDLNVGSYEAKIVSSTGDVLASSAFKIIKAPMEISAWAYKWAGNKYRFDADVYHKTELTCLEKGTIKFKINGKTYNVKIRDAEASLIIKMPKKSKTKTYKCTAIFGGDKNHQGCKVTFKVKVKATKVKKTNKKKVKSKKKTTKKAKTKKKTTKKKSKYKIITTKAKMHWITKKSGKFTVKTIIWDMTAGIRAPYKYIDTTLYKNGKQVYPTKYSVKYKINGKWTRWAKYGTDSTAHHRYSVKDSASVGQIKVKVNKKVNSYI